MHDLAAILGVILDGYILPVDGFHDVVHWARVLENGLRIAEVNGADREVVTLFALFHDSRRVNEDQDDGHGLWGGELARSLRGKLVPLDDDHFDLLFEACRLHTEGYAVGDRTLLACWDADRLMICRSVILRHPCLRMSARNAILGAKNTKKSPPSAQSDDGPDAGNHRRSASPSTAEVSLYWRRPRSAGTVPEGLRWPRESGAARPN
ncbi:Replicative DNA helicase [Fimbriiglobus ruber]|uniref:Replicative DNA helicase n=1 Tax=Fimbriiglobus ruber TaxID=1908690 RepID=A0A225DDE5_9BACT|nr:Replicative DNA helicase [Fimbriiglobus ruber]